jgi:hypothetical protein
MLRDITIKKITESKLSHNSDIDVWEEDPDPEDMVQYGQPPVIPEEEEKVDQNS